MDKQSIEAIIKIQNKFGVEVIFGDYPYRFGSNYLKLTSVETISRFGIPLPAPTITLISPDQKTLKHELIVKKIIKEIADDC